MTWLYLVKAWCFVSFWGTAPLRFWGLPTDGQGGSYLLGWPGARTQGGLWGGSVVVRSPRLSMPSTKAVWTSWCLQGLEGRPGCLTKLPRTPQTIWGKGILSPHIYFSFKLLCWMPKHLWRGGAQKLQPCIQHLEQPLSKKQELLGTSCYFQDCFSFYSMALVWNK